MVLFTKQFWLGTLERAVKTFAQTAVPLVTAEATGLIAVDWWLLLSVSGAAALVSVLTSVGSAPFGDPGPSLAGETVDPVNTGLAPAEVDAAGAQDDLDDLIEADLEPGDGVVDGAITEELPVVEEDEPVTA